jgi:hypothetical protein
MPDDLVERLLAAIQEREDKARAEGHHDPDEGGYYACPATRSEPYGDLPFGEENCDCGLVRRRDEVLRLCQAHRKIIDRHSSQHVHVLAFDGGQFCVDCGTDTSECTRRGVDACETCGMEPCGTLLALAEGYGIEATP